MSWFHGHHGQHMVNELVARAHINDIKRKTDEIVHFRTGSRLRKRTASLPRRLLRRIRGGGD